MLRKSTKRSHTSSSAETKILALRLARTTRPQKNNATVLALSGELGSGKTTFTQGFARGLGLKRQVTSPTFILMRRHRLHHKRFRTLYHIDCYRIKKTRELLAIGLREIFADPKNVVLVEWPEKAQTILPKGAIKISFKHGSEPCERVIEISKP